MAIVTCAGQHRTDHGILPDPLISVKKDQHARPIKNEGFVISGYDVSWQSQLHLLPASDTSSLYVPVILQARAHYP